MIDKNSILNTLRIIKDKESGDNIVDLGLVSSIIINKDQIGFVLEFHNKKQAANKYYLKEQCEELIRKSFNIKKVNIIISYNNNKQKISIPNIKNTVLISSGKGGVGKSTVALYTALCLSKLGYQVGLLDADIYGPSIPAMLGIEGEMPIIEDNKMLPIKKYGIHTISIGYIINKESAIIWRGPMISKAIDNLILGTSWENIDYLIIDTPPGTGDIHLSITEKFHITGGIIVSTPQKLSTIDAVKSYDLFKRMNVPVIGIIENMSYFIDTVSENKTYIFSHNGAETMAKSLKTNFLGKIPIDSRICESLDKGNPLLLESTLFKVYNNITNNMLLFLQKSLIKNIM